MTVDADHPGCLTWRGQLYATADDRDLAAAETRALERWHADRDAAGSAAAKGDDAPSARAAVLVVVALVAATVIGIAVGTVLALVTGSAVVGGLVGALAVVGLAVGLSVLVVGRGAGHGIPAMDGRVRAMVEHGRQHPAPQLTQSVTLVPERVAAAAPADCEVADLLRWSRTIGSYESSVTALPGARRSVAHEDWAQPLPRRDDLFDPWSLWHHERQLQLDRPVYVACCAELGIDPVREPRRLAAGPEPARVRP